MATSPDNCRGHIWKTDVAPEHVRSLSLVRTQSLLFLAPFLTLCWGNLRAGLILPPPPTPGRPPTFGNA
ncbi:hypothetical protein DPEC_G00281880 [Dallia pectoralis]|uniref:Uncharacterized protein n=1 Tax=Dallia pectoralis TaxID=75939 RepID=A0ACC2FN93_DALPE|nr:hypothetical protein DPEC_G00281880 [Dallia pectoralis]